MKYETVFLYVLAGLIVGGIAGYLLGDYHHWLLEQVRTLEKKLRGIEEAPEPFVEKPTVTMGDYAPKSYISNTDTTKTAGIIETKSPELLEWERMQNIEKQVLGR